MIDDEKQKRWKKGKFLKGELREYIKTCDDNQIIKLIGITNKEELPELVYAIASMDRLHQLLTKNDKKH
jgi:hypothetical protein